MPDFFLESGKQNIILFLLDLMQKQVTWKWTQEHHWVHIVSDMTYSFVFLALSGK